MKEEGVGERGGEGDKSDYFMAWGREPQKRQKSESAQQCASHQERSLDVCSMLAPG